MGTTGTRRQRVSAGIESARNRAEDTWKRVEQARPRIPSLDLALHTYERDRHAGGNLLAGALAFRVFLWMLPFALVLVAAVGFLFRDLSSQELVRRFGISAYLAQPIATATSQTARGRWLVLLVGLVLLVSASRTAAKGIRAVHAIAWRQPPLGLKRNTRAGLVLLGGALVWIGASTMVGWLRPISPTLALFSVALLLAVYFTLWLGASWVLPHGDAPLTALIPGAVLFMAGMAAMHVVGVFWISRRVTQASETYGSLGLAVAILGWLYLFGRLVVASAMLNASRWERRQPDAIPANQDRA